MSGRIARACDAPDEYRRMGKGVRIWIAAVLDVDAHHAQLQQRTHEATGVFGVTPVAAFDVDADWYGRSATDTLAGSQQFEDGHPLAIGITLRPGHARTGGADGLGARFFDDPGAGRIPGIGQNERPRFGVQLMEALCTSDLFAIHGHVLFCPRGGVREENHRRRWRAVRIFSHRIGDTGA